MRIGYVSGGTYITIIPAINGKPTKTSLIFSFWNIFTPDKCLIFSFSNRVTTILVMDRLISVDIQIDGIMGQVWWGMSQVCSAPTLIHSDCDWRITRRRRVCAYLCRRVGFASDRSPPSPPHEIPTACATQWISRGDNCLKSQLNRKPASYLAGRM